MLTDKQITELKQDKSYRKAVRLGMKGLASSVLGSGHDDPIKAPASALETLAWSVGLYRKRVIGKEVCDAAAALLEATLRQPAAVDPESVKTVCTSAGRSPIWMRFDEPRVDLLFSRLDELLLMPELRLAIKRHTDLQESDADSALNGIQASLRELRFRTVEFLRSLEFARLAHRHQLDANGRRAVELFRENCGLETPMEIAGPRTKGLLVEGGSPEGPDEEDEE